VLQPFIGLSYLFFHLVNFFLFLAAGFFNWMLIETVFQFAENFGNSSGILIAWGILRDVGNIFLLFSFVFIGIATILNLENYTMKKTLPHLIIFAALLNFSLFATEAVIDVSNGLSMAINAQSTVVEECPPQTSSENCAKNYGLTARIMSTSGLSAVFEPPDYNVLRVADIDYSINMITTLYGLMLSSIMLTVVFLAAGVMLLIRVIVLSIIMVTAPIGFAGMAVPFLKDITERWWSALMEQSLFAPIFLLLVFIGLKIMDTSPLQAGSLSQAFDSGDITLMGAVVTFAIVIGFFVAALLLSSKLAAHGAERTIKWATKRIFEKKHRPPQPDDHRERDDHRTSNLGTAHLPLHPGPPDMPPNVRFDVKNASIDVKNARGPAAGASPAESDTPSDPTDNNSPAPAAQSDTPSDPTDNNSPASAAQLKRVTQATIAATKAQEALTAAYRAGDLAAASAAHTQLMLAQAYRALAQRAIMRDAKNTDSILKRQAAAPPPAPGVQPAAD